MTNEIITNAPAVIDAVRHYTVAQQAAWNLNHSLISGGGALVLWRYLRLEIPTQFQNVQSYCNSHDGGYIERAFHKIFGKPIQPAADAAQPTGK